MKRLRIPKFTSIFNDLSDRDIPDGGLVTAENVIIDDGLVRTRSGISLFYSGLGDPVMGVHSLKSGDDTYLVFITTKNAFLYIEATESVKNINPRYSEGTVSSTAGSKTITGSGTYFASALPSYWAGKMYLGYGNNYDGITTWAEIDAIVSDTEITLAANSPATGAGLDYFIKLELGGDTESPVEFAEALSLSRQKEILIVCNKKDMMFYFDFDIGFCQVHGIYSGSITVTAGSTSITFASAVDVFVLAEIKHSDVPSDAYLEYFDPVTKVGRLSTAATGNATTETAYMWLIPGIPQHIMQGGAASAERLIAGNMYDLSSSTYYQRRIMFSEAGECLQFGGGFYDITNSSEEISGMVAAKGRIYVFKKSSITEMIPDERGTLLDPFNFVQNRRLNVGSNSNKTFIDTGDYVLFAGESGIYAFDGVNVKAIDEGIRKTFLKSVFLDKYKNVFSSYIKEDNLVLFSSPALRFSSNEFFVFNLATNGWVKWKFPWYFYSVAKFRRTAYVLWDDFKKGVPLAGYIDSASTTISNINTESLYVNMIVEADGIPADTYISSVGDTSVDITNAATTPGNRIFTFKHTWASAQGAWRDYKETSEVYSYLFGSEDGNVYEYSTRNVNDQDFPIAAEVETKDYYVNDEVSALKLLEIMLVIYKYQYYNITIQASMDFGASWSSEIDVSSDGDSDWLDKRIGVFLRGKAFRLRINNKDSGAFKIANVYIGYNDSGEVY